jgi:predicted transcriptional regulator
MNQEHYFDRLLNAVKNNRRLQLLELLAANGLALVEIQERFKSYDYRHSQGTITDEYLKPLIDVGLIVNSGNRYRTTLLGKKISDLFLDFSASADFLPSHSECYEEKVINVLSDSPKIYQELKLLIPTKSLGRVLKRLQNVGIIAKSEESKYVFYFKSRRDPQMERISSTEKRVYDSIPDEGADAEALAKSAQINLRRTYKYLRKLRGKKLVFKRKLPKIYSLTENGMRLAMLFTRLQETLLNFSEASASLNGKDSPLISKLMTPDTQQRNMGRRKKAN